ncbi:hypothetical protein GCM10009550_33860 [Actinocorallia libanotica]|uniref:Uncharacterized protein n=1 Tax=Actinocorallia libanotica TaxID=46162 RepID=A0ABN1R6Q0_9ACTN
MSGLAEAIYQSPSKQMYPVTGGTGTTRETEKTLTNRELAFLIMSIVLALIALALFAKAAAH